MSAFVAPGHCFESTKKIVIKENQDSFNRKKKKRPFLFQFPKSSPRRVFGGCQRPRQRRSGKSGQSGGRSAQLGESAGVVREERIILYHTRSQHQTKIARTSICMCVCVFFFFLSCFTTPHSLITPRTTAAPTTTTTTTRLYPPSYLSPICTHSSKVALGRELLGEVQRRAREFRRVALGGRQLLRGESLLPALDDNWCATCSDLCVYCCVYFHVWFLCMPLFCVFFRLLS